MVYSLLPSVPCMAFIAGVCKLLVSTIPYFLWGVDSVKSTVTILEEGNFTEEEGGFDWRGYFSVGGYHFLWRRS